MCSVRLLRGRILLRAIFLVVLLVTLACKDAWAAGGTNAAASSERGGPPGTPAQKGEEGAVDSADGAGTLRTINLDGTPVDLTSNLFFKSLGSNGRSCATCHVASTAWTLSPDEVQQRFDRTQGLDPLFRVNDGSTSPLADISTLEARRTAFSMLLNRAVIRVGLPIPANAEFELAGVDDPYGYASSSQLSLFRRPLPATNLRFLTAVMWDGRESYEPMGTTSIRSDASPADNADALIDDLMHQANGATTGHAQGHPLSPQQQAEIAQYELNLVTAQLTDRGAGRLDARSALGGPAALALEPFYVTINDVFGGDVLTGLFDAHAMPLYDAWSGSDNPQQAAIARGAKLFGEARLHVTDVGGLNDVLGAPELVLSCTSCHDSPNVGNHSTAIPLDLGLTDEDRRTDDMPLYTLRNRTTGAIRKTTDPGRALLTGRWEDIGKFKGPILRGLAARPPYFHDGSAADLGAAVDFYNTRFDAKFTEQDRADLVAFLSSL